MVSGRVLFGLLGLGGIVSTACSATFAATMRADLITPPAQPALSDLTLVDPLGYDCIREEDIDLAFHATGKGVRLPRTCLPEPCDAALTPVELAGLIGRDPVEREWDDYVSRYADYCRKEVVPFSEDGGAVAGAVDDAVAFWAPLAARYPASAPIRSALPGIAPFPIATIGSPPGSVPGEPFGNEPPDPEGPGWTPPNYPPDPVGQEPLTTAPLHATWLFLLTGLLCLARGRGAAVERGTRAG